MQQPVFISRITLYHGEASSVQPLGIHICNDVDIRTQFDNKEITMRIESDVKSKDRFFTDLNGFQITARKHLEKIPLQANFYPMPSMAFIQDDSKRFVMKYILSNKSHILLCVELNKKCVRSNQYQSQLLLNYLD